MRSLRVYLGFIILVMASSYAEANSEASRVDRLSGFVQLDGAHTTLTNGYSNWNDQYLRVNLQISPTDQVDAEISRQTHFDDQGIFWGVGYTRILSATWYGSLHVGSSAGGFFLPRARVDASINKKWLEEKNLVTSFGVGYYQAKDIHTDHNVLISARYYFSAPWIIEVGARLNQSDPGAVFSRRGFAVLTYGHYKQRYLVFRFETGNEAYQIVGSNATLSDFNSSETSIACRQWLSNRFGLNFLVTYYTNPIYERKGLQVGVFYEF